MLNALHGHPISSAVPHAAVSYCNAAVNCLGWWMCRNEQKQIQRRRQQPVLVMQSDDGGAMAAAMLVRQRSGARPQDGRQSADMSAPYPASVLYICLLRSPSHLMCCRPWRSQQPSGLHRWPALAASRQLYGSRAGRSRDQMHCLLQQQHTWRQRFQRSHLTRAQRPLSTHRRSLSSLQ